jgi:hypothetical protein
VLIGHNHQPSAPTSPSARHSQPALGPIPAQVVGPRYDVGAIPTLRQLRGNFAVLRRPKAAADQHNPPCGCGAVDRTLTRLARTLPDGSRVFFVIPRSLAHAPAAPLTSMQVFVQRAQGGWFGFGFGGSRPSALSSLRSRRPGNVQWLSVVPDGVSSVRWTVCAASKTAACLKPRTYTVAVIDNVAAKTIPNSGQCGGCRRIWGVQWFGPDGVNVARFDSGYNLGAPPFIVGERTAASTLQALTPHAVAGARIGQPIATAVRSLTARLGTPAAATRTRGCGVDVEYVWASPATANPLTMYAAHGRFVGYRYGSPWHLLASAPGPGAVLTTPRGITVGTTIGAARQQYSNALNASRHRDASWRLTIGDSQLRGQVIPARYPPRTITDSDQIANIIAGHAGCQTTGP